MPAQERSRLAESLGTAPDPRRPCRNRRHRPAGVPVIGFCGAPWGCDDFAEVEEFGRPDEAFCRRSLGLPHGIPAHDTSRRVYQRVCPRAPQSSPIAWLKEVRRAAEPGAADGAVVAIDGQSLRRTFGRARGPGARHLVSAWATGNGSTPGRVAVDGKSDEIAAIPRLLELLGPRNCVATVDAAGCQTDLAARIAANEADSVRARRDNQPTPHGPVADDSPEQTDGRAAPGKVRRHRRVAGAHGRTAARDPFVAPATAALLAGGGRSGLATVVMVIRQGADRATGRGTDEVRDFLGSLPARARRRADAVRRHRGIENGPHGVLEVACDEDRMRQRDRTGVANLALLKRPAVSRLGSDETIEAGVGGKRKTAGWNDEGLVQRLFNWARSKCARRGREAGPLRHRPPQLGHRLRGPALVSQDHRQVVPRLHAAHGRVAILGHEGVSLTYNTKRVKNELFSTQRLAGHENVALSSWGQSGQEFPLTELLGEAPAAGGSWPP
jgi:predicted transposase YbfD/YdcC